MARMTLRFLARFLPICALLPLVFPACGGSGTQAIVGPADGGASAEAAVVQPALGPWRLVRVDDQNDSGHMLMYTHGHVFSPTYSGRTVDVYDARTYARVAQIPAGRGAGHLSTNGTHIFVSNRMAADLGVEAYLTVIDPVSLKVVRELVTSEHPEGVDELNLPTTQLPWATATLGDKLYGVFPTNFQLNVMPVRLVDWKEGTFVRGGSGASQLVGAAGRLFVINKRAIFDPKDDALMVLDPEGREIATLETGGSIFDLQEAGGRVWLTRQVEGAAEGEWLVVEPQTLKWHTVPVVREPQHIAVQSATASANGKVWTVGKSTLRVQAFDQTTEQRVEDIDLAAFELKLVKPRGLAVTPDGDVFIESEGAIAVLTRRTP